MLARACLTIRLSAPGLSGISICALQPACRPALAGVLVMSGPGAGCGGTASFQRLTCGNLIPSLPRTFGVRLLLRGRPRRGHRVAAATGRPAQRLRASRIGAVPEGTPGRDHDRVASCDNDSNGPSLPLQRQQWSMGAAAGGAVVAAGRAGWLPEGLGAAAGGAGWLPEGLGGCRKGRLVTAGRLWLVKAVVSSSRGTASSPGRVSPGTRPGPRRPHRSCRRAGSPRSRTPADRRARHR